MEPTYTMIGADGKQYGPVSMAQMHGWVGEGRVTATTQILRSDTQAWLPAAQYAELGLAPNPAAPAALAPIPGMATSTPTAQSADVLVLQSRMKSGASWFYWIAGLSLINSIAAKTGSLTGFALGLGVTRLFDLVGQKAEGSAAAIILVLDFLAVAIFGLFGYFAHKGHSWSFIVGMILYALDGLLLFLIGGGVISIGFHAFALFCIFMGLKANMDLKALTRRG